MKFGIIKETKSTPDRRLVFTPDELARLKQIRHGVIVKVESSYVRAFSYEEYKNMSINISDCEAFFGVNEVPIKNLIPYKSYFFFSRIPSKSNPAADIFCKLC